MAKKLAANSIVEYLSSLEKDNYTCLGAESDCAVHASLDAKMKALKQAGVTFSDMKAEFAPFAEKLACCHLMKIIGDETDPPSSKRPKTIFHPFNQVVDDLIVNGTVDPDLSKIDPTMKDDKGNSFLHRAAHLKSPDNLDNRATRLLLSIADDEDMLEVMYSKNRDGNNPLHVALLNSNHKVFTILVNKLVERSEDGEEYLYSDDFRTRVLNEHGNNNHTPLVLAMLHKNAAAGHALVRAGAEINIGSTNTDEDVLFNPYFQSAENPRPYLTPFYAAVQQNLTQTALFLLKNLSGQDAKASVSTGSNVEDVRPIHLATKHGNLELIKELIKHGAGVNVDTEKGIAPLHMAASRGHMEVVKYLINQGANLDQITGRYDDVNDIAYHQTALWAAMKASHFDVAKELVRAGADVNIVGSEADWSLYPRVHPLFFARYSLDMAEFLLTSGSKITPDVMLDAIKNKNIELLRLLLDYGASPNTLVHISENYLDDTMEEEGVEQATYFLYAIMLQNTHGALLLASYGANVNARVKVSDDDDVYLTPREVAEKSTETRKIISILEKNHGLHKE